ncbi:UNVERIFIED_CONTAM: hypothetical protein Sradi_5733200 [Sesamum radiatum]|uniref:DDE Tnp4 domain-containing protein n=1 Tax=Sesamum radiatum TaxID=300843 RepID=A0AAW2L378_SESRA
MILSVVVAQLANTFTPFSWPCFVYIQFCCPVQRLYKKVVRTIDGAGFKGCLGALDGTHVDTRVPEVDKGRYHWDRGTGGPQNKEELFNLRHSTARNVIERTFGLLKTRWGILRSPSYYTPRTHNRIIMACCLLYNFLLMEMPDDPIVNETRVEVDNNLEEGTDFVSTVEATTAWSRWRDELGSNMYNEWLNGG